MPKSTVPKLSIMQKTIKFILKGAKAGADAWESSPEHTREKWIEQVPSQSSLLG